MIVKTFAFSVSIYNFSSKCYTKQAINYFFHTQVNSGRGNTKVQNTFLTKFKIMKLKIDACSMFMIFWVLYQRIYESIYLYSNP